MNDGRSRCANARPSRSVDRSTAADGAGTADNVTLVVRRRLASSATFDRRKTKCFGLSMKNEATFADEQA